MANLYDDASLVMIPTAYKDGKLYSHKPTDGDGDFTFSRGSNLAATRVDVNGLIEKGRENLLLQSNNFSTTWTGSGWTTTSGQTGYDGSNDAWLLTDTLGTGNSFRQNISKTGVLTFSAYFKAGSIDGVRVRIIASPSNVDSWWNLADSSTEPYAETSAIIDRKKEILTNGWVRLSISFNATSTSSIRIYSDDGSTQDYAIGNFYIQDAQLEAGLVATDYIETGASTAQAGILEDMPRLDYSGGASCPALLLEPQRTNLVTQSEYFSSWTNKPDVTLDFGYLAPDGTNSAYKVTKTNIAAHIADNFGSTIVSGVHKSIWAKTTSGTGKVNLLNHNSDTNALFTITNEWQRFDITHDSPDFFYAVDFRGSGTTLSEVLIWGAQAETGSYPTSYIPTYGASVTRSKDYPSLTIDGDITDSTEGSVVFDFKLKTDDTGQVLNYFTLNTGTSNNIRFGIIDSGGTKGYFRAKKDGTDLFSQTFTISDLTARNKFAFRWGDKDWKLYHNGTAIYTNTTSSTFESGDLTKLESGIGGGTYSFYGEVNQISVFPVRLTDSELESLTE